MSLFLDLLLQACDRPSLAAAPPSHIPHSFGGGVGLAALASAVRDRGDGDEPEVDAIHCVIYDSYIDSHLDLHGKEILHR